MNTGCVFLSGEHDMKFPSAYNVRHFQRCMHCIYTLCLASWASLLCQSELCQSVSASSVWQTQLLLSTSLPSPPYCTRRNNRLKSVACISLLWLLFLSGYAMSEPGSSAGVVPSPSFNRCLSIAAGNNTGPSMDSESLRCVKTAGSAYAKGPLTRTAGTPRLRPSNPGTLLARVDDHAGLRPGGFVVELTGGAFTRKQTATKPGASASATSGQKPPPSSGVSHACSSSSSSDISSSQWPELRRVLRRCLARAGSGGLPGAAAGVLQVLALMWMRTVINYQYRYGTSLAAAISELYRQGGVLRFYEGVSFALISNPLSRFGMAAANEGAMALRDVLPWPMSVTLTTWVASLLAGGWRIMLTPLDTCKTVLQVEGSNGFALLMEKVWGGNPGCLYQGAMAAAAATAVGYFPWFLTFNYLNAKLKRPTAMARMLLRNAGIGLAASISSDVCSNSIRVLKTTKQAAAAYEAKVTYRQAANLVMEADGWLGLFGRGLSTRILANGVQSMVFTVVWRYLHDKYVVPWREATELREAKSLGSTVGSQRNSDRSRQR